MKRGPPVVLTVAALAVFVATGYGRSPQGQAVSASSIEVAAYWTGSEEDAFLKVVGQFTKDTGVNVTYTPVLDFTKALYSRLAAGDPPDIAMMPQPGFIASLAHKGVLKDLSTMGMTRAYMKARYGPDWIGYGTVGGKLYGVPTKAISKSSIWYRPDQFRKYNFTIPETWKQLLALTKAMKARGLVPWAVGAGPANSEWVLGDWVENIYARAFGPTKYKALFTGKLPFTDPSVTTAIRYMAQIINKNYVLGGIKGVLGSTFGDGIGDVFGPKPKAELYYEGGFVGDIAIGQVNPTLKIGKTIDDFPWPTINPKWDNPVTIGADYAVAFKDNPKVKEFLRYITSEEAGEIWASAGTAVPNKLVPGSAYQNRLTRQEAAQLASAKTVLFDGDDQMPGSFEDIWCFGLQKAIKNPSVANIKRIEAEFQKNIAGQWGN
jgi:alpha-glucoside transport system substrate-binding protein